METREKPLYLIRLFLDSRSLFRLSERKEVFARQLDLGYLVHCRLAALFGRVRPQPFAITRTIGPWLEVLAYSESDHKTLFREVPRSMLPTIGAGVRWEDFSSKKMPDLFPAGHRVSFRLRACPVERKARGNSRVRMGAEVDVFLAALDRCPDKKLDRYQVYCSWLKEKMETDGAVECLEVKVVGYRRSMFVRRNKSRDFTTLERPDVTYQGQIAIRNPEAFKYLLARGIGRHRAFGFGMLLLSPAGRQNVVRTIGS